MERRGGRVRRGEGKDGRGFGRRRRGRGETYHFISRRTSSVSCLGFRKTFFLSLYS